MADAVVRAIRNVGGFFSDYYLFELLAKKHAAKLDPNGRAWAEPRLRQMWRRADSALDELSPLSEVKQRWYGPLLQILEWEITPLTAPVEIKENGLVPISHVVLNEDGEPLIYVDLHGFGVDVDNHTYPAREGVVTEPIDRAIDRALNEGDAKWAMVFAGPKLRLYRAGSEITRQFLEVDFRLLFDNDDPAEFLAFWGIFRRAAFMPDDDGRSLVERIGEESHRYATQVADDLRENVREALEALIQGAIDHPDSRLLWGGGIPPQERVQQLFEEGLYYLYRLLFILYAESRDLLPASQAVYREAYSLEHLRDYAEQPDMPMYRESTYIWETLAILFDMVKNGVSSSHLEISQYNGQLFARERIGLLRRCKVTDAYMRKVILELSLSKAKKASERRQRFSYDLLGPGQLGSIYEGLLVYEPMVTREPMAEVALGDTIQLMPLTRAEAEGYDVLAQRPTGTFLLRLWGGRRKGSGSYYTPEAMSGFLVRKTLEPLVKGKSAEEILHIRVLDPAMGSGAFLIQACRYLAEEYGRALIREGKDEDGKLTTEEFAEYKRLVAERCLYGVDLNPMAVELAKVSLWLETLAVDRPLTFLDHHLRCGNSLIGAWMDKLMVIPDGALAEVRKWATKADKERAKERVKRNRIATDEVRKGQLRLSQLGTEELNEVVVDLAYERRQLEAPDDSPKIVESKERLLESLKADTTRWSKLKQIADLWCAAWFWPRTGELEPPDTAVHIELVQYTWAGWCSLPDTKVKAYLAEAKRIAREQRFFHWELEFPEAFRAGTRRGFDAVVGNPPWDVQVVNSLEFFSDLDPLFRSYDKKEANNRIELMCQDPKVASKWAWYQEFFGLQTQYVAESMEFEQASIGQANLFKLFLQRFYSLLRKEGMLGAIVPSGLYTDQTCTELRKLFFTQSEVQFIYGFENRARFFPIDSRFKFVLFCTRRQGRTDQFKGAFMLQSLDALASIDGEGLTLSVDQVKKFSPDTWGLMEFKGIQDLGATSQLYRSFPLLGESKGPWQIYMAREVDMTDDSHILKAFGADMPVYEGKMIWQYDNNLDTPRYWVTEEDVATVPRAFRSYGRYRIAFRDIAASTNEVTLIAAVVHPRSVCGHSLSICVSNPAEYSVELWLCALFNSLSINYLQRQKITNHNSVYFMEQLPIPRPSFAKVGPHHRILARAARLICTTPEYFALWNQTFHPSWRTLAPGWEHLPAEWDPTCGITDEEGRAQVKAEIDALVGHLYGLSEEQYEYILSTFPVLKRKEEERLGEYRFRRLCLEAYNRFGADKTKPSVG